MNKQLWQRVAPMLAKEHRVVLATCGEDAPTASAAALLVQDERIYILLDEASEHLFNLQQQGKVVLVARQWHLHGHAAIEREAAAPSPWYAPSPWHVVVRIVPTCLHILSEAGTHYVETIDFAETDDVADTGDAPETDDAAA